MDNLQLPGAVNYFSLIGVFLLFLLLFHLIFTRWWPLGVMAWKRVDYVWLTVALLGVIGSLGYARQIIADGILVVAESRLEARAGWVSERITAGTSGAVCRIFLPSELISSPEEHERIQREFDELCAWFTEASSRSPLELLREAPLSLESFSEVPLPVGGDQWYVASLLEAIGEYNAALSAKERLSAAAERNTWELLLLVLGPYLLALAIALRLTKVTGEIKLHRLKV